MAHTSSDAYVLGVGLTKFLKPRRTREYPELGYEACVKALTDAQVTYDEVQTGIGCYAYGDTTSTQRVLYQLGMTGIPIYNVNNACATGSTGLHLARRMVKGGLADCVLVVGFEQMRPGSIKSVWDDRPSPLGPSTTMMEDTYGKHDSPRNAQYFGNAGQEYIERYGAKAEDFAEIARISHEHSQRNPYAQFQTEYSLDEILKSTPVYGPLTKLQCSPTSDGAGAAVIVSQRFLDARPHLKANAILMAGQALLTDGPEVYSKSAIDLVGFHMSRQAAAEALKEAGAKIEDIKVCEVHDCFSTNELLLLDALGFAQPGKAHEMVRRGDITYGGRGPIVNPSGGLISKGHPLGATGLAQCAELTWQLRGWANNRLVQNTGVALQHNLGLGGAVVVTIYKRADGKTNRQLTDEEVKKASSIGYNPAVEARYITPEDGERVRSKTKRHDYPLEDTVTKLRARI
ncbi:hypothetical protein N7468_008453 [Penicillium chermesinum]|uniref:propanoyl-CoA C-acyltransferase n=1 Tax=Penicillium chermesinum TaxID=63820 RepID=A0A9W9TID2_9EURO|nr:uncharacterized protein N7468_008453 [Penicillium chermesinum]KAJ5223911.1 hypothetical protein N7468_008453 [Penicillium chermesinum]KAJ6155266.1 hypothetical protein N7470_005832 [Penicillium chermesinum]